MEEEKKKRKNNNKKKKNKQQQQIDKAATEDDAPDRVMDGNHVANGKHEGGDVERDKVSDDCVVSGNLENSLKQLRCENDLISEEKASLESKVMELQSDKESWLLKEVSLEEKISKLSTEKAFMLSEQGNLKETIEQIKGEKESWVSKEMIPWSSHVKCHMSLVEHENICTLLLDNLNLPSNHVQNSTKEVISMMDLDIKSLHLQTKMVSEDSHERDSLISINGTLNDAHDAIFVSSKVSELEELNNHSVQENIALKDHLSKLQTEIQELEKNAFINHSLDRDIKGTLDQKIRQLSDEKTTLVVKQEVLEDKIQQLEGECQSWISKENSSKDEISNMGNEIKRLRLQVVEIEELKGNAVEENQSLKERISELEERIKELEKSSSLAITSEEQAKHAMEHENLNSQIEAACALVEKLITENAELVEKVNELYLELDQQNTAAGLSMPSSSKSSIQVTRNARFQDEQPKSYEITLADSETILQDKEVIRDAFPLNPLDSSKTGEIVQIPLDDLEAQVMESQETVPSLAVPLSDAPLVGAPFRFISFMARYVTGADLVDKPKA